MPAYQAFHVSRILVSVRPTGTQKGPDSRDIKRS